MKNEHLPFDMVSVAADYFRQDSSRFLRKRYMKYFLVNGLLETGNLHTAICSSPTIYQKRRAIHSEFSSNAEANASELLENCVHGCIFVYNICYYACN